METVGEATWAHSLRALRPGGTMVIGGATSGAVPPAELNRVFFLQLSVVGSTMGTRDQLGRLLRFCEQNGVRPLIDRTLPLAQARDGLAAMISGDLFGKVVFTVLARGGRPPRTPPRAIRSGRPKGRPSRLAPPPPAHPAGR